MKILFAYTDINIKGGELNCNYGIAGLSAVLKRAGHRTELAYIHGKYDPTVLNDKISSFKPDVLAFSSMSAQFRYVSKLIKSIDSKLRSDFLIICGGVHPTLVPECLEKTDGLDAICIGEGEHSLLNFVHALEPGQDHSMVENFWVKVNGKIKKNTTCNFIADLDDLPFDDLEIFDYQKIIYSTVRRV